MWPMIGSLRVYNVFYVLSMAAHIWLAIRLCKQRDVTWKAGLALGLSYVWGMTAGAKILYDLLNAQFAWRSYLDLGYYLAYGYWGGPMAYMIVAAAGALVLARDRRMMLDVAILALPVPLILAKVACLVNGCCYGAESAVPWAMSLAEGALGPAGVPRHPTPLYEILVLLVIVAVFAKLDRARWKGTLSSTMLPFPCPDRNLTALTSGKAKLQLCCSFVLLCGLFLAPTGAKDCSHGWSEAEPVVSLHARTSRPYLLAKWHTG